MTLVILYATDSPGLGGSRCEAPSNKDPCDALIAEIGKRFLKVSDVDPERQPVWSVLNCGDFYPRSAVDDHRFLASRRLFTLFRYTTVNATTERFPV